MKYTPATITSILSSPVTAANSINQNFADIATAIENTLSRGGDQPNQMEADLDLNDNDLINVRSGNFASIAINGQMVIPNPEGNVPTANIFYNQDASDFAAWMPSFSVIPLSAVIATGQNALLGAVQNTRSANTLAFPTGVTGYGRSDNAGNQVFGIFGRTDLYNTGVGANEFDAFNWTSADSSTNLPPDTQIGTAQTLPIALMLGAGGSHNCSIGMYIAPEGATQKAFNAGIYTNPKACIQYGVYVDSTATDGPAVPLQISHRPNTGAIQVNGKGTPIGGFGWLTYEDGNNVFQFVARANGALELGGALSIGGNQVVSTQRPGWQAGQGTGTRTTFFTSLITLEQLAERVKALIDDLLEHGLIGA